MPYNFHAPHLSARSQYSEHSVSSPTHCSQCLLLLSFPQFFGYLGTHIRYKAWSDHADQTLANCHISCSTSLAPLPKLLDLLHYPQSNQLPCEKLPMPHGEPQCYAKPWCQESPEAAYSQSRNTCL